MLSFPIVLATLLSLVGTHLTTLTDSVFYLSSHPWSESGQSFLPVLDVPSRVDRIFEGAGTVRPAGGSSPVDPVAVTAWRRWSGADQLSDLADHHFEDRRAEIVEVGTAEPHLIAGAWTVAADGTAVTGTGGAALSELTAVDTRIGGRRQRTWISLAGEIAEVSAIASDNAFTLAAAHSAGATAAPVLARPVYSWAHPRFAKVGRVLTEVHDPEKFDFTIGSEPHELGKRLLKAYAGFGDAAYFDGAGSATGPVWDPAGDFTVGARWFHFLESETDVDSYLLDNGDIRIVVDLGVTRGEIETTAGVQTVTAPTSVEPEQFHFAHLVYDASETLLTLIVDGVVVATNDKILGTLNTSASAWELGGNDDGTSNRISAVIGEWRLYDAALTDDTVIDSQAGPLDVDADDLVYYWTGEAGTSNDLFEFAAANEASPVDATLAGTWARASFLDDPELSGNMIPRGTGDLEHIPATQVDRNNGIYQVVQGPIQEISDIYEGGESSSQAQPVIPGAASPGVVRNTFKQLLDNEPGKAALTGTVTMTLGSTAVTGAGTAFDDPDEVEAGDTVVLDADDLPAEVGRITSATVMTLKAPYGGVGGAGAATRQRQLWDQYPHHGAFRLPPRRVGGALISDVQGESSGIRGRDYDGVDDFDSHGTNDNDMFTTTWEAEFWFSSKGFASGDRVYLIDNAAPVTEGWRFQITGNAGSTFGSPSFTLFTDGGTLNPVAATSPLTVFAGVPHHVLLQAVVAGGDVTIKMYLDFALLGTQTATDTLTASANSLFVGKSTGGSPIFFGGSIYDLRFLSGNRSISTVRQEAHQALGVNRSGLRHYYPAYRAKIDGSDWFPGTTLVDEAEGDSATLTGTVTFTTSSTAVSASGGAFTTEVVAGDVVRHPSDGSKVRVASVTDNDNLVLVTAYPDTGGATAGGLRYRTLDGTMTGATWIGGASPPTALAIAEHFTRDEAGLTTPDLDLADAYDIPTGALQVYSTEPTTTVLAAIQSAAESYNGWNRWESPTEPTPLTGTWSVTAGTKAVTGSGTAAESELSDHGSINIAGERRLIASIESDIAVTLVDSHVAGAAAVAAVGWSPRWKLGWIEDPISATVDVDLVETDVLAAISQGPANELPPKIFMSHRWIHKTEDGSGLSERVSIFRRARWAQPQRWAKSRSFRNRKLGLNPVDQVEPLRIFSRFRRRPEALAEAARQRDIWLVRRPALTLPVRDPGARLKAGRIAELTHTDLRLADSQYIIFEVRRQLGSSVSEVVLVGAKDEPA